MSARANLATPSKIVALAFVMLAIGATVFELGSQGDASNVAISAKQDGGKADPFREELMRCQALGETGTHDSDCLRAWAENRRRFLSPGVPPLERPPLDLFSGTPRAGGFPDPSADQPRAR